MKTKEEVKLSETFPSTFGPHEGIKVAVILTLIGAKVNDLQSRCKTN